MSTQDTSGKVVVSIGFMFPIFLVLLIGQLAGWWAMSWWLVFLPIYIGPAIVLAFALVAAILAGIFLGGAWILQKCGK